MKFLWKIREPKIQAHYHPDNLVKLLSSVDEKDEEEFDRVIDNW